MGGDDALDPEDYESVAVDEHRRATTMPELLFIAARVAVIRMIHEVDPTAFGLYNQCLNDLARTHHHIAAGGAEDFLAGMMALANAPFRPRPSENKDGIPEKTPDPT